LSNAKMADAKGVRKENTLPAFELP
jgi:hypothetical protein